MRILALDTSGPSQSVAVLQGDQVLSESLDPHPSSHSETLLEAVAAQLKVPGWSLPDVELFAVTWGPGSFTGLRIGLSTVKGLCRANPRPVVGVSTLLALASSFLDGEHLVIPCLDARCGEVYVGAFRGTQSAVETFWPDSARPFEALLAAWKELPGKKLVVGDAVRVYASRLALLPDTTLLQDDRAQRVSAAQVGRLAWRQFREGSAIDGVGLAPRYLRASEAENRRQQTFRTKEAR